MELPVTLAIEDTDALLVWTLKTARRARIVERALREDAV